VNDITSGIAGFGIETWEIIAYALFFLAFHQLGAKVVTSTDIQTE
jgi:hypothetical protein